MSELVPVSGPCATLEGEFLRAAGKLGYEAYNNGCSNNVSSGLIFLKKHFPGFRDEWWTKLGPYVTGQGGQLPQAVYECCEEIVDAVVMHADSRAGVYLENPEDMLDLQVRETGLESEAWEDDENDEDEDVLVLG